MTSRKVHFICRNWGQSQDMGLGVLSPCWMSVFFYRKSGWSRPLSTNDTDKVTCKRCIIVLAKMVERILTSGVKCVNCAGVGMNTKAALSRGELYVRCAPCNGTGVCEVYQP